MTGLMDKTTAFFDELKDRGVELTGGQTALVCNDGVVMVSVGEDGEVDVVMCNNKVDIDYNLGITDEDVDMFKTVAGIAVEMEE